jgi:hypothetical protein
MNFDIRPYEGAGPVNFGMNREEIHGLLGLPNLGWTMPNGTLVDSWNDFIIRYATDSQRASEIEFAETSGIRFDGIELFRDPNALSKLVTTDGAPLEGVGSIIFLSLGISTSANLVNPKAVERTVCVFSRGKWDRFLSRLVPYEAQPQPAEISS